MTGLVSPSVSPSEEAIGAVPANSTPRRLHLSLHLLASGVTTRTVVLAVVTSLMAGGVGRLQAWPLWAIVLAMVVPATPVLASPAAQLRRHDGALALFYLLVLAQTGHVFEHLTQVTQLHVLHHTGEEAHGVFGALDVEWVHFIWNAAILLAVVFLLRHYRRNVWLWSALILAGWHQVEHTYIMSVYLQTAQMGTPGLLAAGGALGGGLPLRRPDLHFLYNVLETTPLVLAFLHQMGELAGARRAAVITESPDPDRPTALPQPRRVHPAPRTKSQQKARSRQRDMQRVAVAMSRSSRQDGRPCLINEPTLHSSDWTSRPARPCTATPFLFPRSTSKQIGNDFQCQPNKPSQTTNQEALIQQRGSRA